MENQKTPPYVSYSTFKNALDLLQQKTVPAVLDGSVLSNMSGSNRAALLSALRFLDLTSPNDSPTDSLKSLVKASPEDRQALFKAILDKKYPTSSKALIDGTPTSMKKNFEYEVSEAIKGKCVAFVIGLGRDAGISISPHISSRVRIKRPNKARGEGAKRKEKSSPPPITDGSIDQALEADGLTIVPIPIGIAKTWKIAVGVNHTDEEVNKFTDMVKLVLLKNKKS